MNGMQRTSVIVTMALAGAVPALAQEAAGDSKSILDIIWDGIEWPTYFIVLGSIASLTLIVEHFLSVRRGTIAPAEQVKQAKQLIETRNFRECMDGLKKSKTFFARVMTSAMQHARHGFDAMHEAAIEKSGEMGGAMFRKVEYLNIMGNLGPLLGLLGTVLGMIEAFAAMGEGGGGSDAGGLAGGISKALVNTMLGLALAIIGLGFFGVCRNRVDSLTTSATVQVLDLLEYFRPAAKRASQQAAQQPAQAAS